MKAPFYIIYPLVILFAALSFSHALKPETKPVLISSSAWDVDDEDKQFNAPEILDWSDMYIDPYMYNYASHQNLCLKQQANESTTRT